MGLFCLCFRSPQTQRCSISCGPSTERGVSASSQDVAHTAQALQGVHGHDGRLLDRRLGQRQPAQGILRLLQGNHHHTVAAVYV